MEHELYHYGVLGMKWGIRKARKNGTTYTYKSYGQKKMEKRLANAERKGKDTEKIKNSLNNYKRRDKMRQSYVEARSTGRLLATKMIFNLDSADAYRKARDSGASFGKSYIDALVAGYSNGLAQLNKKR